LVRLLLFPHLSLTALPGRYKNCDDTVKAMVESVEFAHSEHGMNVLHRQEFSREVESRKAEMKLRLEQMELMARGGGGGMMGMGGMLGMLGLGDEYVLFLF